jgi:outer membrane cobalamin receptor
VRNEKILSVLFYLVFAANIVLAQDIFITLTKCDESIKKLPVNITVITQKTIKEKRFETLGELLQNEVGIDFKSNGTAGANTSISIRGASSLQTLVLVDGRRINDIGIGSVNFTSIPANIIERVEIIRGSGAAVYGTGAFGGVVNVITKKATKTAPVGDVSASYGSFNTFSPVLNVTYLTDKYGAFVSISNISSDGDRENSKFMSMNTFFSGHFDIFERSKLSLSGNIYKSEYGVPGQLSSPTLKNEQKDNDEYIKFDYDFNMADKSFLNLSGYSSDNIRFFYDANGNPHQPAIFYKYNSNVYGIHAEIHYKGIVLAGLEFENRDYKENKNLSRCSLNKSMRNYAVYTQFNLPIGKIVMIPAIRYDNNSQYGNVFTPSASAVFNIGERVKISANTGKIWRAPVFTDLYWNQPGYRMYGNPDLKPEYGISNDFGIEYSHNKVRLAGTAYYIDSKDLINWDYANERFQVKNIDKSRQYGFEFEAVYIVTSFLNCKLNYTYLKSENKKTKKVLTYKPENTVNCGVSISPVKNLSVSVNLFYKDKIFTDDTNTRELNSFVTVNLNLNYKINDSLSLWVKGLNVGNARYELTAGYPMPGAAVYAGVSLRVLR